MVHECGNIEKVGEKEKIVDLSHISDSGEGCGGNSRSHSKESEA